MTELARPDRPQPFAVVPSVYLALTRAAPSGAGREVLLQLRSGTGYLDDWWACGAAGHLEAGEPATHAAAREAAEELAIAVDPADLRLAAVVHRTHAIPEPREQRIDLFVEVPRWSGEPTVAEPDKAAELRWWPLAALPERTVPHERAALDVIAAGDPPALLCRGFEQTLTLVAAVGSNGVIGDGAAMPWHLPEDLAHFRATTMGGTLLMGRGTWDSIGRALPGRTTVVLTRDPEWSADGAVAAHSLAEALLVAGDTEVFVVGGGQVYAQTIDHASRLVITEVDRAPEGTVRFPAIDARGWRQTSREAREGLTFVTWGRTSAAASSLAPLARG